MNSNDVENVVNQNGSGATDSASSTASKFKSVDRLGTEPDVQIVGETWTTVLESACTYGSTIFSGVMLNLINNPNVTSSHLFRADILYNSKPDNTGSTSIDQNDPNASITGSEQQPRLLDIPGWTQDRVMVRQLIPRNPRLDRPLSQTCILFSRRADGSKSRDSLVVYIPHIDSAEDMPFYHPKVAKLAFYHSFLPTDAGPEDSAPGNGRISLSYTPFTSTELNSEADNKLHRTALRLLQTIHKHGQGQLAGYEKRVHLDQIIPQKQYQDTYARLKAKYGRHLSETWVEVTDPGKHVFEDLGIAAFCLELWREMYALPQGVTDKDGQAVAGAETAESRDGAVPKPPFPGFVDIGCGNGLLVYILIMEGYPGSGFDARQRKTWSTFPPNVREHLSQALLVPDLLLPASESTSGGADKDDSFHRGLFPTGTFIISNHADELTAWTPLLAHLNQSSFIAIPCCSHDLAGSRFRAPDSTKAQKARKTAEAKQQKERNEGAARLPQQENGSGSSGANGQAAETGSLKRTLVHKKMASAYSTLCAYVEALADAVGFESEREVLRIPSTRNVSIVGRKVKAGREVSASGTMQERRERVKALVEEELARDVEDIGREWVERARGLAKKPSSGH